MLARIMLKPLNYFIRRHMRHLADIEEMSLDELIRFHDLLAIQCISNETRKSGRLLSVSVQTANKLDDLKALQEA